MPLAQTRKRELRGRSHALKPAMIIGSAGLTAAVMREPDLSLEHHELMKVRISGAGRAERRQIIERI